MNRNVNVFIGVILCALLCGCFVWLFSVSEEDTWKPNEIYDQLHATSYSASYTNVTYSVSSNGGLALTMSPSSALRRRVVSSYAGAYSGVASSPLASLPMGGASGAGLHLTSSAEFKSFGGGGNGGAAMGGAISNGRSNSGLSNPSLQGGAGVGSISPIAYSTARRGEMSSATGDNPVQMMAEQPTMAMTSAAGMANGFYGGYSAMDYSSTATYSSTSDYGQYTGMFGTGRQSVRGRQNAQGFDDLWWVWFDTWAKSNGSAYQDENGDFYFDDGSLRNVYDAFIAGYWNSGMGEAPSFDDWKEWYLAAIASGEGFYDYNGRHYYWGSLTPVGDMLPLLLLALLYVLFVAIKSKSSTSLLKTERSE